MRNANFGRSGLGSVSSPANEDENAVANPLSASSSAGNESRDAGAPPVGGLSADDSETTSEESDSVTMPIVPSAPAPSDVLSALSAPLAPQGFKGREGVVPMSAPLGSEGGWTVGDHPPPPVRREESARISEGNRLAVATAPQIAPDDATRPWPNTEAELRAELMRVRTEAANALSAAEDRLASAARAMNAHKDPARRTLGDQV